MAAFMWILCFVNGRNMAELSTSNSFLMHIGFTILRPKLRGGTHGQTEKNVYFYRILRTFDRFSARNYCSSQLYRSKMDLLTHTQSTNACKEATWVCAIFPSRISLSFAQSYYQCQVIHKVGILRHSDTNQ